MVYFNCSANGPAAKGTECEKSCNTLDMACVSHFYPNIKQTFTCKCRWLVDILEQTIPNLSPGVKLNILSAWYIYIRAVSLMRKLD